MAKCMFHPARSTTVSNVSVDELALFDGDAGLEFLRIVREHLPLGGEELVPVVYERVNDFVIHGFGKRRGIGFVEVLFHLLTHVVELRLGEFHIQRL